MTRLPLNASAWFGILSLAWPTGIAAPSMVSLILIESVNTRDEPPTHRALSQSSYSILAFSLLWPLQVRMQVR